MKLDKKILFVLTLLFAVGQQSWAQSLNSDSWSVWDGVSESKPYIVNNKAYINTAAELAWFTNHVNNLRTSDTGDIVIDERFKTYNYVDIVLNANLDMTAGTWIPIGNLYDSEKTDVTRAPIVTAPTEKIDNNYQGHFHGNGHTIRIEITGAKDNYQGLIGCIGSDGAVSDLHVDGVINCAKSRLVGGITGENIGTIRNCWVSARVSSRYREPASAFNGKVGGIAGENDGTIEYCCMSSYVDNDDADVGGIVGDNAGGTVRHCTFYGNRYSEHKQDNVWVGDDGTESNLYYWGDDENGTNNLNASQLAAYLAEVPWQHNVYRYALQYPYSVTFNTTGQGRIVASPARARYGDRVNLNVESGHVKEISCKLSNGIYESVIREIYGNEDDGYYTILSNYSINIKVDFDESVVNLTANDGGDGYYWRSYYGSTRELVADENTMVYQAALKSGTVELSEVPGRNYVLSRGNDGKGSLGFYKLSGETIEADKAYLEIPRIIPFPAAVTINK